MTEQKMTNYRWVIVALLFFATTVNYIDRQVIGLLKDYLAHDFNWSEKDYSHIVMAFTAAYAAGLLIIGRGIDITGTKLGYTLCVIVWSIAATAHAFVTTTVGFISARTVLGWGESGNFPTAIRSVAEWFPKKERAFATGIFNSGTNVAAVIGPFMVMWIYHNYGWRPAFIWTGVLGFAWLIFWSIFYDIPSRQKRMNQVEFDYIHNDADGLTGDQPKTVSWKRLIGLKPSWAFILGKFFTDPIWWFYLFWIPSYFNTVYHLDLQQSWIYVSTIYGVAGLGSVLGGWYPGKLISKGWSPNQARKTAMLLYAILVVPIVGVRFTTGAWSAVALISLAAAAHQAWSANLFTIVSDRFPKNAIGSVVGLGGMMGSVGGVLFPLFVGQLLDHFKSTSQIAAGYNIIFGICSVAYLVAWLLIQLLSRAKNTGVI